MVSWWVELKYDIFSDVGCLPIRVVVIKHGYVGECDHSDRVQYRKKSWKWRIFCDCNSKSLVFSIGSDVFLQSISSERTSIIEEDIEP